jgi:hypothetical protein
MARVAFDEATKVYPGPVVALDHVTPRQRYQLGHSQPASSQVSCDWPHLRWCREGIKLSAPGPLAYSALPQGGGARYPRAPAFLVVHRLCGLCLPRPIETHIPPTLSEGLRDV